MNFKKTMAFTLVFAMIFSIFSIANPLYVKAEDKDEVELVILGTSDIHGNIYGFAYEDNKESKNNGMARLATYVNQMRAQHKNVILVDNGDTYQGNILTDAIYNKKDDVIHPMSKAINHMKYDAFIFGNHEFNFGSKFVHRIIKELEVPVLTANMTYKKTGELVVKPYIVVEREGVKIGILGLTNPNAPRWDGEKVDDFNFLSIPEEGAKYAKILKEKEKVDVVLVVSHAGLGPEYDYDKYSDSNEKLLEMAPEVDALLVGHYHIKVEEKINNAVVAGPRAHGRDIVEFHLKLKKENGKFKITSKDAKVIDMTETAPDQALRDLIKKEHELTLDFIKGEGGSEAGVEGGGIFGQASENFQPANEIKDLPQARFVDTAVMDLIGKVQLEMSGADVTTVALFKDTSDLKKGNINYGDLFNIYKFDNTLYTVNVTGKELKAYMEWSAVYYNQVKDGDISISFNEDVPGYKYDIFKGVEYEIDLSQPAGNRIKNVKFKGQDLKDDQVLKLAVNNYRYSSALKAEKLVEGNRDWESSLPIRDTIAEYIKKHGTISPSVSNNWKIVGVNLEHPLRAQIIELVNTGKLEVPYHKSLNIKELEQKGIIVDGKVVAPKVDVNQEMEHSEGPSGKKDKPVAEKPAEKPADQTKLQEKPATEKTTKTQVVYIVKKGDFLARIAANHDVDYRDIARDNNIKNPHLIFVGQKLIINK